MEKTYLITGIEPGLMKEFKTACAHYDISMRDVFIKHMWNIVNDFNSQKRHKPPSIINSKKGGKKK